MAKPRITTAARLRKFITVLTATANASLAAREAGMASSTAYRHRTSDDRFRRAWDEAIDAALDALEAAVLTRATSGVEKPVVFGGKQVATVTNYSDALAMFLLRSRRPQVYARPAAAAADPIYADDDSALAECERRLDRIAARPPRAPEQ